MYLKTDQYVYINNEVKYGILLSDDTGRNTTSSAPHPQGKPQRQTLLATSGQKRCPSVPASGDRTPSIPIHPHNIPFYPDFRPQPEIKGMSLFSFEQVYIFVVG